MAKWQTSNRDSRGQVEPEDEFIELSELDFEDLPETDPTGYRNQPLRSPPVAPPAPRSADFAQLRHFLRTPVCVEFENDRVQDLTPPPVVGHSSIAPTSASLPPQDDRREFAPKPTFRWTVPVLAVSATLALGIVALRVVDKTSAYAPTAPMTVAMTQPIVNIPRFTPEDFPIFEEPADEEVEYTWIDLTNAPREDLPPGKSLAISAPVSTPPIATAVNGEQREPAAAKAPADDETPSVDETVDPPTPGGAFDRDEADASLTAVGSSAVACRGDAPAGFAKVSVTFAPSGRVTTAVVDGPFAGTPTGGCIAKTFRTARVQPFDGSFVTVRKTIILP